MKEHAVGEEKEFGWRLFALLCSALIWLVVFAVAMWQVSLTLTIALVVAPFAVLVLYGALASLRSGNGRRR